MATDFQNHPGRYRDRQHAGQVLAGQLAPYSGQTGLLVLALPRGGVPVAFEVAKTLGARLDILSVRKLGLPGHAEYAVGAIAPGPVMVRNPDLQDSMTPQELDRVLVREQAEMARRTLLYRGERLAEVLDNRTLILVDDGMATGATMRAAVLSCRQGNPAKIVVAVPVADPGICDYLRQQVDDLVCPLRPAAMQAVGLWYDDFSQTSDAEVQALLRAAWQQ